MGRYQSFGERVGAVSTLALKNDDVPQSLRNAVWNLSSPLFQERHYGQSPPIVDPGEFLKRMALDKSWLLVEPDYRYRPDEAEHELRAFLIDPNKSAWHEVYEYLESFYRWAKSKNLNQGWWEALVKYGFSIARSTEGSDGTATVAPYASLCRENTKARHRCRARVVRVFILVGDSEPARVQGHHGRASTTTRFRFTVPVTEKSSASSSAKISVRNGPLEVCPSSLRRKVARTL
jgi:hypothetical protein